MTKLIDDGRLCTEEANKLLTQKSRFAPRFHGEAQFFQTAHMFGHYDSRGGGTLVLGAKTSIEAIIQYNRSCGWDDMDDAGLEDFNNSEGQVELVVCDRCFEDEIDLLDDFDGTPEKRGYLCARLEERYVPQDQERWGGPQPWKPSGVVVMWVATHAEDNHPGDAKDVDGFVDATQFGCPKMDGRPNAGIMGQYNEYRLNWFNPGEDACGLILMRVKPIEQK